MTAEGRLQVTCEGGCPPGSPRDTCYLHRGPFVHACPRCGAGPGIRCHPLKPDGWRASAPHVARRRLAGTDDASPCKHDGDLLGRYEQDTCHGCGAHVPPSAAASYRSPEQDHPTSHRGDSEASS